MSFKQKINSPQTFVLKLIICINSIRNLSLGIKFEGTQKLINTKTSKQLPSILALPQSIKNAIRNLICSKFGLNRIKSKVRKKATEFCIF